MMAAISTATARMTRLGSSNRLSRENLRALGSTGRHLRACVQTLLPSSAANGQRQPASTSAAMRATACFGPGAQRQPG